MTSETPPAKGENLGKLAGIDWGEEGAEGKLLEELERFVETARQMAEQVEDTLSKLIDTVLEARLKAVVAEIENDGSWQFYGGMRWESNYRGEGLFSDEGFPIRIELTPAHFVQVFKEDGLALAWGLEGEGGLREWVAEWRDAVLQVEALLPPPGSDTEHDDA